MTKKHKTAEVFGQNAQGNPLSYVTRNVEILFRQALENPGVEAIVVFGTSKQGKSSLRRSALPDDKCTFFPAASSITRAGLYKDVLDQAGAIGRVAREREVSKSCTWKTMLQPWLWFGAEGGATTGERTNETVDDVPVDYSIISTVARKYKVVACGKPIVIDNFHYIDGKMQKDLATD
ncbi:MAG: hypothetical protein ACREXR_20045, partial [Gammaproteobacteria bacterium]